ncbi:MAG: hypothetical protein OEY03_04380 [Rhizobacter sp.]|nr:hypothetical protein [Rhizobacter sp.]
MKLYLDPRHSSEVPALIRSPNRTRKRYPEGVVEVVVSEREALERAAEDLHPALVVGPSRSSEGFRMYYLVRWLR